MSRAPGGDNVIGSAGVVFTGDTAPLEASAKRAVEITQDAAAQAQETIKSQKITSPYHVDENTFNIPIIKEAGVVSEETSMSFGRLRGSLLQLSIPFTLATAAALKMAEAYRKNVTEISDFINALDKTKGAEGLSKILDKQNEVADSQESIFTQIKDSAINAYDAFSRLHGVEESGLQTSEDKLAALRKQEELYVKLSDAQKAAAAREKEEAEKNRREGIIEDVREQTKREVLSRLEGLEKIEYEEVLAAERIAKLRKENSDGVAAEEIDILEKQIANGFRKRRESHAREIAEREDAENKALTEREKRESEAAARVAERTARALSRALSGVQQQADHLFNVDKLSVQLNELAKIMERVASNTRNING